MKVLIPSVLHSYTGRSQVTAEGATLAALFDDLDRQFPGLRFRVIDEQGRFRPHMRCFINGEQSFDLAQPLHPDDDIVLMQALSGG
jgi:sulfur-carrier protein